MSNSLLIFGCSCNATYRRTSAEGCAPGLSQRSFRSNNLIAKISGEKPGIRRVRTNLFDQVFQSGLTTRDCEHAGPALGKRFGCLESDARRGARDDDLLAPVIHSVSPGASSGEAGLVLARCLRTASRVTRRSCFRVKPGASARAI